ncbi:hypothetical protein ALC56_08309 [Trachymyrmex septentrionalis]|uniref:Uncharacterized protein n=1 Tax=Trachymyrmex septentrionalis TaxID=34720 RepID=A0A195FAL4_9HYME|nr:hypothetical protein ALC56_08309 [Trachymyrmex septentrionalis]
MARPGVTGVRCWRVYHGRVHGATRRFLEAIKPHEAGLRSAFDRIVLNAYLRAALPRAMHEEPRVIAGIVDE